MNRHARLRKGLSATILFCLVRFPATAEQPVTITIDAAQPGARINPAMWGVFFEDINFGADGGLYAELVKNRSFEFIQPLQGWSKMDAGAISGSLLVCIENPLHTNNPHYLRISCESGDGAYGIANEGFSGMGIRKDEKYHFSVYARSTHSPPKGLVIELTGSGGGQAGYAQERVLTRVGVRGTDKIGREWKVYTATLRATETVARARLNLIVEGPGIVDVDMVSLFPEKTWRRGPLREDLVQMLTDLKPGFVRFPGGCIVEGRFLKTRYQWKNTIGKPEERPLLINRWNDEFQHRPAPDYFQSFGLGFFEYFQMCEDIGAQPLPILNCGMACQFNSKELAPTDQLQTYIQDALDLIEFANGSSKSRWGSRRAAMGHPKPFGMKMLGVGNEQWGPEYIERYAAFAKALKDKHPEIQLISSAGPRPDDDLFQFLWPKLTDLKADIIDEHCYATPDWFLNNANRYDRRARLGPKVFMGEYAAQSVKVVSPENRNNWGCALAEAAYMTGLERNADLVVMSSYAPLFAHVDLWQWRPNLIWFDNLRVFGTPNYYVQQLFSRNRGDRVVPLQILGAVPMDAGQSRFYASATRDEKKRELIVKVVNATPTNVVGSFQIKGVKRVGATATSLVLTSPKLTDENSLDEPRKIAPREESLRNFRSGFQYSFAPNSFTVLRIPAK